MKIKHLLIGNVKLDTIYTRFGTAWKKVVTIQGYKMFIY